VNYIYDQAKGWTPGDASLTSVGFEQESAKQGYKLSAKFYTNFFSVKVFEAPAEKAKFPWVLLVQSSFNQFVIQTATLPAFLDCCAKLLINDVSA